MAVQEKEKPTTRKLTQEERNNLKKFAGMNFTSKELHNIKQLAKNNHRYYENQMKERIREEIGQEEIMNEIVQRVYEKMQEEKERMSLESILKPEISATKEKENKNYFKKFVVGMDFVIVALFLACITFVCIVHEPMKGSQVGEIDFHELGMTLITAVTGTWLVFDHVRCKKVNKYRKINALALYLILIVALCVGYHFLGFAYDLSHWYIRSMIICTASFVVLGILNNLRNVE